MKKLLNLLTIFGITTAGASMAVSCGPKIESDVLLILPGNSMTNTSQITAAYKEIASEFNLEQQKISGLKVKIEWENGDAIQDRISSFQQLPDLYVSYPDAVSQYVYGEQDNDVRDMEQSLADPSFKDKLWNQSFYQEGTIKNQLYILPLNKSFNFNILNLKLFKELAKHLGIDLKMIDDISTGASEIFNSDLDNEIQQSNEFNSLKDQLLKIKIIDDVRNLMNLNENLYQLTKLYVWLHDNENKNKNVNKEQVNKYGIKDLKKMYSFGIDDVPAKIYSEYADQLQVEAIDPQANEQFFYNIKDIDAYQSKMNIILDNPNGDYFKPTKNFFNEMKDLTNEKLRDDNDVNVRWSGPMLLGKLDQKTYASSIFVQGGMLMASGSSAGTFAYNTKNIGYQDKENHPYDMNKDLLVIPNTTAKGNAFNFVCQGPGIAGFKSVGKNAKQKEETVTKFLQYLTEPTVLNKFALQSNYIPSTTTALQRFENYRSGKYDNVTGKWQGEQPQDFDTYSQINQAGSTEITSLQDQIVYDFLKGYAETENINVIITKANPAGSLIRNGINNALQNYIFRRMDDFGTLLGSDSKNPATLISQIRANLPDFYSDSKIWVRGINDK